MKYILLNIVCLCCLHQIGISQMLHIDPHTDNAYKFQKQTCLNNPNFHSAIQPYHYYETLTLKNFFTDSTKLLPNSKLTNKQIIAYNKTNSSYQLSPVLHISDLHTQNTNFLLSGGIRFKANIGSRVSFFAENTVIQLPKNSLFQSIYDSINVYPQFGIPFDSTNNNYLFMMPKFYFTYMPFKHVLLETGLGKHFLGEGYRSLFLSTNAQPYPYLKINASFFRFKYHILYANFKDIRNHIQDSYFDKTNKYGVFHYLSCNIGKRWNIALFEGLIWASEDSLRYRGFDVNYLNPVIFFRPVEFSLGSPDNSFLGFAAHYRIPKKYKFYLQFFIDDFFIDGIKQDIKHVFRPNDSTIQYGSWMNKQALQVGAYSYNFVNIKNLDLQAEFNIARPYTYSHRITEQNYGHYNQSLAHPFESNFKEWIFQVNYSINRLQFNLFYNILQTGIDNQSTHVGQDIYKITYDTPEPGMNNILVAAIHNTIGQGIPLKINNLQFYSAYRINPEEKLSIFFSAGFRQTTINKTTENTPIIQIGISNYLNPKHLLNNLPIIMKR